MGEVQVLKNFSPSLDLTSLAALIPELTGTEKKLAELEAYIKPQIFWREMTVDYINKRELSLDQGRFLIDSAYVAIGLRNCQKATLFAITLDKDLPQYSQFCLEEGRLWESTIADILGSNAIEMMAEKFHNYLVGMNLPKGLFSTLRFSPGYGDWELSQQKEIISYLETGDVIKVNENYLLEPVKSITALIGWSNFPQANNYPQGEKRKGFCQGSGSCVHCTTWACRKN